MYRFKPNYFCPFYNSIMSNKWEHVNQKLYDLASRNEFIISIKNCSESPIRARLVWETIFSVLLVRERIVISNSKSDHSHQNVKPVTESHQVWGIENQKYLLVQNNVKNIEI